jgi:crotonobetainyl-CoA:carnitine CoA-transferase CaiB-like acyl-CoA transferase
MMAQARAALVRGDPPRGAPCAFVDQFGGMMLAMGVMLALAAREKTGRGQVVDSCLLNVAVFADTVAATNLLNRDPDAPKKDPRRKNPLYMAYKSADQRWVYIIGTFRDKALLRAFRALGIPQEIQDQFPEGRMKTTEDTLKAYDILAEAVAKLPADEVVKRVRAQDMMSVKVAEPEEVFDDPQVLHNRMVEEIECPPGRTVKTIGFPVKLSDTPARVRIPPPELGRDNEAVLRDILGIGSDRIRELYEKGVLHRAEPE